MATWIGEASGTDPQARHDLIRHPEMTREMGGEALARASEYRYEEMVDAYVRVYAEAEVRPATSPAADGQERGCAS